MEETIFLIIIGIIIFFSVIVLCYAAKKEFEEYGREGKPRCGYRPKINQKHPPLPRKINK